MEQLDTFNKKTAAPNAGAAGKIFTTELLSGQDELICYGITGTEPMG